MKTQFAVVPRYDVNNVTRSRSTTMYLYPMKCINLNVQNIKHLTDSVELRPANIFANGSAVDHYAVWLVRITVMVMVVLRVPVGFVSHVSCSELCTTVSKRGWRNYCQKNKLCELDQNEAPSYTSSTF